MRALIATAMYPSPARPAFGTFVRTQVEALRDIGVDIRLFVLEGSNRKAMYGRAVPQLRRLLREDSSIDLVHAHYGLVGMVARAQRQVPVVVTFHGDDLLGSVGPDGRIIARSRVIASASRRLAGTVDAVIVQSEQMAARVPAGASVHVIPHEVDLELFRPEPQASARAALGLDPHRPMVLFAASPAIAVKRFPLAADAVRRLRERLPEVELLIVHEETQRQLVRYLSACDALVLTSYQEGSPNVVKQAMACGLPVVATPVGDVPELLRGVSGCAVVAPDADAVADALHRVLDPPRRTAGRERVQHLRSDIVAGRVLEVYERATGVIAAASVGRA